MKTSLLHKAFRSRGLVLADVSRTCGIPYQTLWQHMNGARSITAEQALRYESLVGIPRSELRPDLWPPEGEPSFVAEEREPTASP